jgi:hypothetical protein
MAAKDRSGFDSTWGGPVSLDQARKHDRVGGAGTGTFFMRAYDTGTSGYVFWSSSAGPLLTPSASQTTPNFTGTLQNAHVYHSV